MHEIFFSVKINGNKLNHNSYQLFKDLQTFYIIAKKVTLSM